MKRLKLAFLALLVCSAYVAYVCWLGYAVYFYHRGLP